jgi:hypothetical protein
VGSAETLADSGSFILTEDRVIVWVPKWTRGSRWVGAGPLGITFALAARGISAARAAHRRRGTALVAHIPHRSIVSVEVPRSHRNRLIVVNAFESVSEPFAPRPISLLAHLSRRNLGEATAAQLVQLAARRRLDTAGDRLTPEDRSQLEQAVDDPQIAGRTVHGWKIALPGARPIHR